MGDRVEKVLAKIQAQVASGNFYEAHEMLKTVFHRYRAKGENDKAYPLLVEGAKLQLQKGQLNCGMELGLLLLEAYGKDKEACTDASLQRIMDILGAFPTAMAAGGGGGSGGAAGSEGGAGSDSDPSGSDLPPPMREYRRVAMEAVRWARKTAPTSGPAEAIHRALAGYLWEVGGLPAIGPVAQHYARGNSGEGLARVLSAAAEVAQPQERDLLAVRGCLQLLAAASAPRRGAPPEAAQAEQSQRVDEARTLLNKYLAAVEVGQTPIVNFIQLLLESLERRSASLEGVLRSKYAPSLARDPEALYALLERVEQVYLGIQPPSGGFGGIMGDMLKMFLGGEEE